MAEEVIVRRIEIRTEGAERSLGKVDKANKQVTKSTSNLDGSLGNLPGPLGKAKQGIQGLSKAFKALLANPVVLIISAIVLAIVGLFKAFKKTEAGADKFGDAMSALGAIMEVIIERAAQIFKALGKIFRGKFKEGFDDIKDSVKGAGEEMAEAARAAIALEQAQRKLYETETDVITANAKRRQQIAELVFLTRDQTKSIEERRNAIIEADKIEKQILADNLKLQEQRVANQRQEIENTPELQRTREQSRKLAEEEAKLIDLQTQSLTRQRELKNRLNELDNKAAAERAKAAKEEAERQKEIEEAEAERLEAEAEKQAELDAIEKERLDALAEEERKRVESLENYKREQRQATFEGRVENLRNELEQGLILQEEFDLRLIDLEQEHQDELAAIQEQARQEKIAADQAAAQKQAELIQQQIEDEERLRSVKMQIYEDSLTALLGFLGEESKIAKGIQIADATRQAIQAAIAAYSSASAIPIVGVALGPIAAAAALAAGMANVRKIAQTKSPIEDGSASVPSVAIATPGSDLPSTDELTNADVGIAGDVNIVQDQTRRGSVKTYVVESDVTAEQEIAEQREADVTI